MQITNEIPIKPEKAINNQIYKYPAAGSSCGFTTTVFLRKDLDLDLVINLRSLKIILPLILIFTTV